MKKKVIYHIKDKKNICGIVSDNVIPKKNRTLEEIERIIEPNINFIRLCKKCKQIMEKK